MKGILNRIKDTHRDTDRRTHAHTHTHIFVEAVIVCENDNYRREAESGLHNFLAGFP